VYDSIFGRTTRSSLLKIPRPATATSPGRERVGLSAPGIGAKPPRLLLPPELSFEGWWESLALVFSRAHRSSSRRTVYLFRHGTLVRAQTPGKPLSASFALHCVILLLLIYARQAIPANASPLERVAPTYERIYYPLPAMNAAKPMPRIAPAGAGARPGDGAIRELLPALGSTVRQGDLMAVSNPVHPDNFRQTIYQRSSPPDVHIATEQNLPNIVLGAPSELPKAPLKPSDARPSRVTRKTSSSDAAPTPVSENASAPLMTFLQPSDTQPRLPIPTGAVAKPNRNAAENSGSAGSRDAEEKGGGAGADLLVLGVDPSGSAAEVSLPTGNRWGSFSISPAGGTPGSAGGVNYGMEAGGKNGIGAGGDGSTGVGSGQGGGGGGKSALSGVVSIRGTEAGNGSGGSLGKEFALSMVYPVPSSVTLRKNSLVVAVGPMGGGGLGAYGALHCGKIYSIFLAMPGKSWAMEYCVKSDATEKEKSATETRSTVVHLERGLVPPDAEARFDFRRLPVPPEKVHKMIVLKGTLRDDGSVENLELYQGVLPQMDEAARVAFSQWKFKPAVRDGKPVAVEILVGVPTEDPGNGISH
jgi:Gram-negative bacterial TonB protein C-terminal